MKESPLHNTIGFKLTLWYMAVLVLFGVMMLLSVQLAMWQARQDIPRWFVGGNHTPLEAARIAADRYSHYLRVYSALSFGGIVIVGGAGGYILSRKMLEPVDKVTRLARNISTTNLKDRIDYQGPDDEMKRLADTFDEMLTRLEGAFESQKQFIEDASHELRTPIAVARTNIEVLEMEKNPTSRQYKQLIEVLKLSIDRMEKLNEKLLILTRDNPGGAEKTVIDIACLLQELASEFTHTALNSGIELELVPVPGKPTVEANALELKLALGNVLNNAIRYNRSGGRVSVSARHERGWVNIRIEDSGVGIAERDIQRIFDRFYRVDKSRSRNQGGSGLGLAIVKDIIQDLGGRVEVESTLGQGSLFTISLPRHSAG